MSRSRVLTQIADLEISNASLLAVNHSLEAAKAKQGTFLPSDADTHFAD